MSETHVEMFVFPEEQEKRLVAVGVLSETALNCCLKQKLCSGLNGK